MNIKVLQWLLRNQTVLVKIVEVAKGWRKDSPYFDQWEIVDTIARLLIPLIDAEKISPKALAASYDYVYDAEGRPVVGSEPYPVAVLAAGAKMQALGIDWELVVNVILPLVISILQALASKEKA